MSKQPKKYQHHVRGWVPTNRPRRADHFAQVNSYTEARWDQRYTGGERALLLDSFAGWKNLDAVVAALQTFDQMPNIAALEAKAREVSRAASNDPEGAPPG